MFMFIMIAAAMGTTMLFNADYAVNPFSDMINSLFSMFTYIITADNYPDIMGDRCLCVPVCALSAYSNLIATTHREAIKKQVPSTDLVRGVVGGARPLAGLPVSRGHGPESRQSAHTPGGRGAESA